MENITIAIADDHTAVRRCFISTLSKEPGLEFIAEAGNGQDLLDSVRQKQPDIILLDIKMPGLNGIEVLKILHLDYPKIRVLILSAFLDVTYVARCLELGINGYLTKFMEIEDVVIAIKLAYQNKVYFTNLMTDSILRNYILRHKKNSDLITYFTDEEVIILKYLQKEITTEEISSLMHLSKRSIEIKRDKMREKVGARTIAGLLLYAFKIGVID